MRTLLLNLVITSLVVCFSFVGRAAKDESLLLYYSFDKVKGEEVEDLSGNENIGTLQGGAEWVKDGKFGGAISFDGSSSHVRTPDEIKGLTDIPLKEFTAECWVNLRELTGDTQQVWEALNAPGAWPAETFVEGTQDMTFYIYDDKGTAHQIKTPQLSLKEWHHLAGTYDGSVQRIYLDGKVADETSWSGTFTIISKGIAIGTDNEGLFQWLSGLVDDFAIYTRALTEREVKQDMEKGVASAVSSSGKLTTVWGKVKTQY
ncbi:MAG: LamG domain-containing protein [Candidatus Poribacteria bacterium]